VAAACVLAAGLLYADTTPVMVSLLTPVQVPLRNYDVTGFRLSLIYGDCRDFAGFDLGAIGRTAGEFCGAAIGGANIASEGLYGGQIGLINWCGDPDGDEANRSVGAQIGLVNCSSSFAGLQYGALNVARGRFYGLQDGAINVTGGLVTGIQCGFVNYSGDVYGAQCGYYMILGVNIAGGSVNGCQLGLVNYATDMGYGLQIGGINIIASNGWLMVLPLFNWHF